MSGEHLRDPAGSGGPRGPASRDRAQLVARGARSGAVLGVVAGLVSGLALLLLGGGEGAVLLVVAAAALSAAVGAATGAVGGRLVAAQVEAGSAVRPLPVVVTAGLVAAALLVVVSASLSAWWAGPGLAGAAVVLALVRVAGLARAARASGPLPPLV